MFFLLRMLVGVRPGGLFETTFRLDIHLLKLQIHGGFSLHFSRMDFVPGLVTTSNSAGSTWRLDFPALTMPPGNDVLGEGG